MPYDIGCAVSFAQQSAGIELVSRGSSVLILLAAGILVYRTFRERYLLVWLLGWCAYLAYRLASFVPDAGFAALSDSAFVFSVALFAAAVLYYTNARQYLFLIGSVTALATGIAVLRAGWFPGSVLLKVALHLLYMAMTVGATIQLALFSRGRRELGPWLLVVMLLCVHLDEVPKTTHALAGFDLVLELLLGLSMMVIVLDNAQARTRRLAVVSAITEAIAQTQDSQEMMLRALQELKDLVRVRAAWYRVQDRDRLVMGQQIGLSAEYVDARAELFAPNTHSAEVMREGAPAVRRTAELDARSREHLSRDGLEHVVLIPIRGKSSVIGILGLGSDRRRSYTREELDFLLTTANQLGIALENLELWRQILRSQRQWISTFDSIDDLILVHDNQFRITKLNRALLKRLARPYQEVLFQTCGSVLPHPERWSGCPYCSTSRPPLADLPDPCFRSYTMVSTSSYSEQGSEGLTTIHVVRDTGERRAAEEKYRILFEQMQEGVFVSTPDGRFVDCNDAFVRMLGYQRRAEIFALDARQVYLHPDQREAFCQEIAARNYVRDYEVAVKRRDGSIMIALENSFAVRDSAGRILRYQGFLLDVTEKKRVESEIRRRNRELNVLNAIAVIATQSFDVDEILNVSLRHMIDLFGTDTGSAWLLDADGLTLHRRAGYGHRSEFGTRLTEMKLSQEFWEGIKAAHVEVITQRRRPDMPQVIADFLQAEELRSWIWTIMWSNQSIIGAMAISSREQREFTAGDEHLVITIGRQLATTLDRVRLYEETCRAYDDLRRTQEQLLQSEKMSAIGQMISGVAHELNNPLTAILGYSQLLESENLGDRCRDYVQKLFKQAQRTQRVVQNLLSFARQRKTQKMQVDLRRTLEEALALRDYDMKLNNIAVERQFDPDLPGVVADAHQIEQVFLNIINNAVDAVLEKGRTGVLRVRMYTSDRYVCCEFEDSGPGLKEPSRVFDPFYTTKTVGKGTGLGLSICYGIIKEHHGDILAMNAPAGGALFRLLLPASGTISAPAQEAPHPRREMLEGRVLLVDDEEAVLEFEREVLAGAGARVSCCAGYEEAVALLQREAFDAIIIDTKMPGAYSGRDLYWWIAQNRPGAERKVVVTLSNVSDPDTRDFLEKTGVSCVVKPFEVADLIAITRRILQRAVAAAVNAS